MPVGSSSIADHAPTPEGRLWAAFCVSAADYSDRVLIAYLDEFGHVGPYVSPEHGKFFHNPVFGYAGIILPASNVRAFGAKFEHQKARQFRAEIFQSGKHPRRWEKKGAEIFTTGSYDRYPERVPFIAGLADYLIRRQGKIFFYGEVKSQGTTRETGITPAKRTSDALINTVRRLCEYAESVDDELLILLDEGGPMPREDAITSMASFIYSSTDPSMRRIIEVPMQLESHRYGPMQFADWLCAILSRSSHFHFSTSDEFAWAPRVLDQVIGSRATRGSRIWVPTRHTPVSANALRHSQKWILRPERPTLRRSARLTQRIGDVIS